MCQIPKPLKMWHMNPYDRNKDTCRAEIRWCCMPVRGFSTAAASWKCPWMAQLGQQSSSGAHIMTPGIHFSGLWALGFCISWLGTHVILSEPSTMFEDDDTAPTVEYDDEEDSHGTIFRFDLRAVRYVKVWSSISSTATAVHFSEIAPCHRILPSRMIVIFCMNMLHVTFQHTGIQKKTKGVHVTCDRLVQITGTAHWTSLLVLLSYPFSSCMFCKRRRLCVHYKGHSRTDSMDFNKI